MNIEQDWQTVTLKKSHKQPGQKKSQVVAQAAREGTLEVVEKPKFKATAVDSRKLDSETDTFEHAKISQEFKIALMQKRNAKGLTQAQLAQKIGEKASIINSYESGKAIPDPAIVSKLVRVLGPLPKIKKPGKIAIKKSNYI